MSKALSRLFLGATTIATVVFSGPASADNITFSGNYTSDAGNPMSDLDLSTGKTIGFGMTLDNKGGIVSLELTRDHNRILIKHFPDGGIVLVGWRKNDPVKLQWEAKAAFEILNDIYFPEMLGMLFKKQPGIGTQVVMDLAKIKYELKAQSAAFERLAPNPPANNGAKMQSGAPSPKG